MNDAALTDPTGRRSPWRAALLSFVMPGVGQIYCGRLIRGLTLGLIYGLVIPVVLGLLAYVGPASTIVFGLLAATAAAGVVVLATADAYRLATRTNPDHERNSYRCAGAYVLIGLMIQGSSIGYSLHVRATLFEAFRVPAASMYPTIANGDRILVDKTRHRRTNPHRGDIVLFRPPTKDWRSHYVKRIVALGGEADFDEITVPANHCFVLGDNRCRSLDSRHFGAIPYAVIRGRADYIYWPAGSWARFGRLH